MSNTLVFSSKIENVSLVETYLEELLRLNKVKSEYYSSILVTTAEAVTNAIVHGNNNDPNKSVSLTCNFDDSLKEFVISISDSGLGFDYMAVPDPTSPENIEKLNGRGVFLMKQLANRVVFENNGSTVILAFFYS